MKQNWTTNIFLVTL